MVARRLVDVINQNPIVRVLKNTRNQLVDLSFRVQAREQAAQLVHRLNRNKVKSVCFVVAFNVPWAIEMMIAAWRQCPIGFDLVVANNSSDGNQRKAIWELCLRSDIPHVDLPWNPEWHPCRSHGIAMNWLFYNVIRHLQLETFGFLDHDCFPIRPFDVNERLRRCDVYGTKFMSPKFPDVWNMWAGFCFYRGLLVRSRNVDFKNCVELGLDTGGGNWQLIYSHLDPQRVGTAELRQLEGDEDFHIVIDEAFLHVGGASFRSANQQRAIDRLQRLLNQRPPLMETAAGNLIIPQ
jgi:hypothetical protein